MKAVKVMADLTMVFVSMPIWFFLMYTVLSACNVDRLVWFLFWVYIPVTFFGAVLSTIAKGMIDG